MKNKINPEPKISTKSERKLEDGIIHQENGKRTKKSKYGNVKTEVYGIKFDSKKEAKRYEELLKDLMDEKITDLRLQHEFTLQEAFMTATGLKVQSIKYVADFTYYTADGEFVVEDTKSEITRKNPVYRMKFKMMLDKKGIQVIEV